MRSERRVGKGARVSHLSRVGKACPRLRAGIVRARRAHADDFIRRFCPPYSAYMTYARRYSAAMRTSGAAERTSASTSSSYLMKFDWNMPTSFRAVSSKAALSRQVFMG
jgi:hypothetical protein